MNAKPPVVVGIDPSLTRTGLARIGPKDRMATSVVVSSGKATDGLEERYVRLGHLCRDIVSYALSGGGLPDLVVIETPAYSKSQGSAMDRHGLWWMVVATLRGLDVPVLDVLPNLRAKYATGKGNAGKDEVMIAVTKRWGDKVAFRTNDEADALVLALMGMRLLGHPVEVSLPADRLAALATLTERTQETKA